MSTENTKVETTQSKALTPAQMFESQAKMYENTVMQLLGDRGISPKKFMVTVINAVKKTPKLLDVDRKSLFGAILTSAELGLEPNTPMGHCYLIPYGKDCQFQIGYQGLIELAYRNPRILSINAEIVYEKDLFEYELGLNPRIKHVPSSEANKGAFKYVYAVVRMKDAEPLFTVLSKADIDAVKKIVKSGGVWGSQQDFRMWMEKKTAIKQVLKLVPKGNNNVLAKAMHVDNVTEGGGRIVATEDGEVEVVESTIAGNENKRSNSELLADEETGEVFTTAEPIAEPLKKATPEDKQTLFENNIDKKK